MKNDTVEIIIQFIIKLWKVGSLSLKSKMTAPRLVPITLITIITKELNDREVLLKCFIKHGCHK